MTQEIQDKLRAIKSSFRLRMNGDVSRSMREKGLGYKLNWGISLPELKKMAAEYGKDMNLAIELWKEDIRECRIMATFIIPSSQMEADLVDIWVEDLRNQEIASIAALNVFQHVPGAKSFAFNWIATNDELKQQCGYNVMTRLFMRNEKLDIREIHEYIDQTQVALKDGAMAVSKAAIASLTRFIEMSEENRKIAKSAFNKYNLNIF